MVSAQQRALVADLRLDRAEQSVEIVVARRAKHRKLEFAGEAPQFVGVGARQRRLDVVQDAAQSGEIERAGMLGDMQRYFFSIVRPFGPRLKRTPSASLCS